MKKFLLLMILVSFILPLNSCFACDDTLVMLLTSKDPNSEFSKVIRNFATNLTALGLALNNNEQTQFDVLVKNVMESWLGFTKKYSNNPPPEAKNDANWATKMRNTGQSIGQIRKLVNTGKFHDAHDMVLDLSGRIGQFFEAFGVSDEKQLFIEASTNLTRMEQMELRKDIPALKASLKDLKANLQKFVAFLPESGQIAKVRAENDIASLTEALNGYPQNSKTLSEIIDAIKLDFEEMRSHILMQEWFPASKKDLEGEKK